MKALNRQRLGLVLGLCLASLAAPPALAQPDKIQSLEELMTQVRTGHFGESAERQRKLAAFRSASPEEQRQLLAQAKQRREELQATSAKLEQTSRKNEAKFETLIAKLRDALGDSAALFSILRQSATDMVGAFRHSPTNLQFPGRVEWLQAFTKRMQKASEIFTPEEIRHLWYLIQQEIVASSKIVRLQQVPVLTETSGRQKLPVVRVGNFTLVTGEPRPLYLDWQADSQSVAVFPGQPADYLDLLAGYLQTDSGLHALGVDPTGGALISRLGASPSLTDRIAQGGLIGYITLVLGAIGLLIAIYKLVVIFVINGKVERQRRRPERPESDNPLGRLLKVYDENRREDPETLEMRLGEANLEEKPTIDRFVGILKVIATVAPLMGLLGTVVGMIATFQSIVMFGAGDPTIMAGGISKALVTTVLGLVVAIPMVVLHAIVDSRAKAVLHTLKHQSAGMIAERMESEEGGNLGQVGQGPQPAGA